MLGDARNRVVTATRIRILIPFDCKMLHTSGIFDTGSIMPSVFSKFTKKRRRDVPDGKSVALVEAGIRLLARKDYDTISMAQIAREAGCSIGTLYGRYSDKNAYLYRIGAQAFGRMTDEANRVLDTWRMGSESGPVIARRIIGHVTSQMTAPRAAGVIRATIKLATVKPLASKPFQDYRTAVTDRAVELLTKRSRRVSAEAVRIGMQIVLGAITDAILHKSPGPMNAGSARMTAALAKVLLGYLGLENKASWAGNETDGEDDPAGVPDAGSEAPPQLDDGEMAIFDPDSRTYVGKRSGGIKTRRLRRAKSEAVNPSTQSGAKPANKRTGAMKPAAKVAPLVPAHIATPPRESRPNPPRKPKHKAI